MSHLILMFFACTTHAQPTKPTQKNSTFATFIETNQAVGLQASRPSTCEAEITLPSKQIIQVRTWGAHQHGAVTQARSLSMLFWATWELNARVGFQLSTDQTLRANWKKEQYQVNKQYDQKNVRILSCTNVKGTATQSRWSASWNNGPHTESSEPGIAIELSRRKQCLSPYAVEVSKRLRDSQATPHDSKTLNQSLMTAWDNMIQCHQKEPPKPKAIKTDEAIESGPFQCVSMIVDNGQPRALGLKWGTSLAQTALSSLTQIAWQGLFHGGLTAPHKDESATKIVQRTISALSGMTSEESHCSVIESIPLSGEWSSKRKASLQYCQPNQKIWESDSQSTSPSGAMQQYCMREAQLRKTKTLAAALKKAEMATEETLLLASDLQTAGCLSDCLSSNLQPAIRPIFLPHQPRRVTKSATIALFWAALEAKNESELSKLLPNNSLFPLKTRMHKATLKSLLSPQFKSRVNGIGRKAFEQTFIDTAKVNGHHLLRFNTNTD